MKFRFLLAHHLEESILELSVVFLLLENRLIGDSLLTQAYIAEVVFGVKLLEEILDILVSLVMVDDAAELCVNNEDHTASEHIMMTEILVNHCFLLFFRALYYLLRCSSHLLP